MDYVGCGRVGIGRPVTISQDYFNHFEELEIFKEVSKIASLNNSANYKLSNLY